MTPPPPETSDERRYPLAKYFVENHPEIEPSDAWAKEAVDLYRERDALKVKRDVALRAWKGAAADRDKAQRQVAELKAEVASLKVENERLQHDNEQLATEANDNAHAAAAQAQRGRELRAEVASLKVENERLKQSAVEVAKLNQPNLEQIMALSVEVESLKAKLAAPSKP
jgi:chromosome segregation ATPase